MQNALHQYMFNEYLPALFRIGNKKSRRGLRVLTGFKIYDPSRGQSKGSGAHVSFEVSLTKNT